MQIEKITATEEEIKTGITINGRHYEYRGIIEQNVFDDDFNATPMEFHTFVNLDEEEFDRRYY
jgi:hypothetical protein